MSWWRKMPEREDTVFPSVRVRNAGSLSGTWRGISKPEMRKISLEELADRIRFASFRELKELYELLTNIRAVSGTFYADSYPAVSELEDRYKAILMRGLEKANRIHLHLPLGVDPKDTAAIILKVDKEGVQ